jgi:hypothetical protein
MDTSYTVDIHGPEGVSDRRTRLHRHGHAHATPPPCRTQLIPFCGLHCTRVVGELPRAATRGTKSTGMRDAFWLSPHRCARPRTCVEVQPRQLASMTAWRGSLRFKQADSDKELPHPDKSEQFPKTEFLAMRPRRLELAKPQPVITQPKPVRVASPDRIHGHGQHGAWRGAAHAMKRWRDCVLWPSPHFLQGNHTRLGGPAACRKQPE